VLGAQWQRCAVHFVRDMLGHVAKGQQPLVRGALKQIFAAPDRATAGATLATVVDQLATAAPKVAELVLDAADTDLEYGISAVFSAFPRMHTDRAWAHLQGMYWDHMNGWGWTMMVLWSLMWIGFLGLLFWAVVEWTRRGADGTAGPEPKAKTPRELLDERLAAGEIEIDEYQARREALEHRARVGAGA
jgi:uncharacterized membrane protein